ncbi:hypothetical protein ACLIIZ_05695 [Azonexus caeni]|uniref:hypothetical protein n=1 Tax=Azonexus caeni TaxID=266126 RepID=UPI003A87DCAF
MTTKENPSPSPVVQPAEAVGTAAAPASAPAKAPARARAPRKTPSVEQTVAKHQQALAEALEKAEAISYDPPQAPKAAKPAKATAKTKAEKVEKVEKPAKLKKPRLVRDSYAMPETEYAQIAVLKKRMASLGSEAKKSELLRAGIAVLAALNDAELQAVMGRIERIKTGRPAKK